MSLVQPIEPADRAGSPIAPPRSRSQLALGLGGWIVAAGLVAALAVMAWSRPATTAETDSPVVRLGIAHALDIYGQTASAFAVSPDGLTLAYYDAGSDGRHVLLVRSLATGVIREVPGTQTFGPSAASVFWSPDSTHIVRGTQSGAVVIEISTGASRPLCDCRFAGGSWSRDGVILPGSTAENNGIRRVSLSDATVIEIIKADASRGERDAWPVFLPDGRRFLFTRSATGNVATYAATLDGGTPTRIVEGSQRLVFSPGSDRGAYLVGIDAAGAVARPFDIDAMTVTGPAVTLQANAVAVSGSDNGVMVTSAPGTRARTAPTWIDRKGAALASAADKGVFESVALSSDGRKLVVADADSGAPGQQNDLWLRDLVTGVKTRLTFNPDNDSTPVWSPDGRTIAYTSRRAGVNRPYKRSADGTGDEAPLFDHDRDAYANDWSSDGRWVIFTTRKPGSPSDNDLWVVPITQGIAGKPVPYLVQPGRQQQAQFSPDGRFVAYGSDQSGTFDIYVQPFPDASQGKWMVSSGGGVEPRWSRDGNELFYFRARHWWPCRSA